ncbi:NUDIX domain-containing protein [Candidatus Woesearchaeota archaeon]|nr:NUDIX domain-containing protein [Candidatus Woesearchaeota archaeon]
MSEQCSGAIILHQGKVLLIDKAKNHYWGLPKGHIEANETAEQAAVREVKEELGLVIRIVPGFKRVETYQFKEGTKDVEKETTFFIAKSVTDHTKPKHEEINAAAWFVPSDALSKVTFSNTRTMLEDAFAFAIKSGEFGIDGGHKKQLQIEEPDASCSAIILCKGKVLLMKQPRSKLWMFPKGPAKAGETEEQTTIREVKHETGLDIEIVPDFRERIQYTYRDRSERVDKETTFLLARTKSLKTKGEEGVLFKWFHPHKALEIILFDEVKDVLLEALKVAR